MNNINIDDFLKNYWQKKPLLIRAAFPNYQSPISAEELAGLACEDFVESRIIIENKSEPKWSLENGPFAETRFTTLPKSHWTVLIQGLNRLFPELDDLLHEFSFIPSWRIDDLMASYAAPNGSVGPHVDQYDVFLLQASGRRKWLISSDKIEPDNFEPDIALNIIKNFTVDEEWVLEAGDMLYLPANVAHHGIAMEDCITFSIGFRAPSHAELLSAYIDDHIKDLDGNLRFKDPLLSTNNKSGEISSEAVNIVQNILQSHFSDKEKIADWFGKYITEYLSDAEDIVNKNMSTSEFSSQFKKHGYVRRPATTRANYHFRKTGQMALYINGEKQNIVKDLQRFIMQFCNQNILDYSDICSQSSKGKIIEYLCQLYNDGHIEFTDD